MKAHLEFDLPDDEDSFKLAMRAPEMHSALEEFSNYLRGQEKYVEPAERDDLLAVRRMWYEVMEGLLE